MSKSKKDNQKKAAAKPEFNFVFGKRNYQFMLLGILVIVIGFALMYGKTDIYDFRKTGLSTIVVLLGFAIEVYAILLKPASDNESN